MVESGPWKKWKMASMALLALSTKQQSMKGLTKIYWPGHTPSLFSCHAYLLGAKSGSSELNCT